MLVGIDLFACPCIEGGQLTWDGRACHSTASFGNETAAQPASYGARSGFGRSRSERVFRNEFPYLGRVGLAASAGFRPVGGDGIDRRLAGP
jgi:hypothetical protein